MASSLRSFAPRIIYPSVFIASLLLTACKKENEQPLAISELRGYVQKGPFIIGTTITVTELDGSLGQTGKTFSATIEDDRGAFTLRNLKLSSKYLELRANGFYFNEVSGKLSTSQLTLNALADVSNAASVNVNLLTHLERSRVQHLMGKEGKTFADAKKQAQKEILAVFNVDKPDMASSEQLNIAETGEDNAILLAISAILQAQRSESELTELLSKVNLDLEKDGSLDNPTLQSALLNEAVLLDRPGVRSNVTKRYAELGLAVTVGDFEKHVAHFVGKSSFAFTKKIEYPATGTYGVNILSDTTSRFILPKPEGYHWYNNSAQYASFSMVAVAPPGTKVRVKIIAVSVPDSYYASFGGSGGFWESNGPGELLLIGTGERREAEVVARLSTNMESLENRSAVPLRRRIEIYENDATVPTRAREITFVGDDGSISTDKIEYPLSENDYKNVLDNQQTNRADRMDLISLVPHGNKVKVRLSISVPVTVDYTNGVWNQMSHQVVDGLNVYEYESVKSAVKAQVHLKVGREKFVVVNNTWVPAKAKLEIFENGSSQSIRVKEFDVYPYPQ